MPRISKRKAGSGERSRPSKSSKAELETSKGNVTKLKALPEVFTVPPKQTKGKKKPGQLTAKQVKQYFEEVCIVSFILYTILIF